MRQMNSRSDLFVTFSVQWLQLVAMDMRSTAILVLVLTLASNWKTNAMLLDVGEEVIQLPITLSFVGAINCLNSSRCGNTTGGDYWTLGAIAAAYEDINNRPDL